MMVAISAPMIATFIILYLCFNECTKPGFCPIGKLNALSLLSRRKTGEEAFRLCSSPLKRSTRAEPAFAASESLEFPLNDKWFADTGSIIPARKSAALHGFRPSAFIRPLCFHR